MTTRIKMRSDQLEILIDAETLPVVIEMAAEICRLKASHIRENWQDEKTAKLWDRNAVKLDKLKPKLFS